MSVGADAVARPAQQRGPDRSTQVADTHPDPRAPLIAGDRGRRLPPLRRRRLRPRPHPDASPRAVGLDPDAAGRRVRPPSTAPHGARRPPRSFEAETPRRVRSRRGPNWTRRDGRRARRSLLGVGGVPARCAAAAAATRRPTGLGGAPRRGSTPTTAAPADEHRPTAEPEQPSPTPSPQAPRRRGVTVRAARRRRRAAGCRSTDGSRQGAVRGRAATTGQRKTFTDDQQIKLVIGNAGAVHLVVNGSDLGAPGGDGAGRPAHVRPRRPDRCRAEPPGRRYGCRRSTVGSPPCPRPPRRVALVTLGLRPQRGRLRGARRPARGRRLAARRRRRPTPTRSWSTPAASSRRPRRTRSTPCSRPPTSRTAGAPQAVVAVGLPGRALRRRARRRRCPRPTPCSASTTTPTSPRGCARIARRRAARAARAARPPPAAAAHARSTAPASPPPSPCPATARPARRRRARDRARAVLRRRLDGGPMAPLKLASRLRPPLRVLRDPVASAARSSPGRPHDVLAEARWLADAGRPRAGPGQRELHVLRQGPRRPARCSRRCCPSSPRSTASSGCGCPTCSRPRCGPAWSRRSRRRPASRRTSTCPSSTRAPPVLRRMRRFGDTERFLDLLDQVRALAPAGRRPLQRHRRLPRRDRGRPRGARALPRRAPGSTSIGVFGYSDEDGTEAAALRRQARPTTVVARASSGSPRWSRSSPRSAPRTASASRVEVLVEEVDDDGAVEGRAAHQGPEVDGTHAA